MSFLNKWKEWRKSRMEKHLTKMKKEDKCPDCHGRGFYMNYFNEYSFLEYMNPLNCPSCNGSGKFPYENI